MPSRLASSCHEGDRLTTGRVPLSSHPLMAAQTPSLFRVFDSLRSVVRFRRFELDPTKRRLTRVANVEDLRAVARRRLPRGVFDYIDGAAEDEITLAANSDAYRRVRFRPRVLRDVREVDPATTLLGRPVSLPLVIAPTGFTRIARFRRGSSRSLARPREQGSPYTLSTLSTRSIEEVAAACPGSKWFQVYVWRDRGLVREMVERAASAGYDALVLTVDTPVLGNRQRDVRNGLTLPPKLGPLDDPRRRSPSGMDLGFRPRGADPVRERGRTIGGRRRRRRVAFATTSTSQFDPGLSWRDVEWFLSRFGRGRSC